MTSSQKIMNKKARFKAEIDSRLPKEQSDALWQKATDRLATLLTQYASLPEGVRFHTENKIFPAAAIYLTLKESIGQDDAYRVIEDATFKTADAAAKKLSALLRLPGMRSLFVKAWDPLTRKMFGENSGLKTFSIRRKKASTGWTWCPARTTAILRSWDARSSRRSPAGRTTMFTATCRV